MAIITADGKILGLLTKWNVKKASNMIIKAHPKKIAHFLKSNIVMLVYKRSSPKTPPINKEGVLPLIKKPVKPAEKTKIE